jgi:hypothetical protein
MVAKFSFVRIDEKFGYFCIPVNGTMFLFKLSVLYWERFFLATLSRSVTKA